MFVRSAWDSVDRPEEDLIVIHEVPNKNYPSYYLGADSGDVFLVVAGFWQRMNRQVRYKVRY